MSFNDIAVIIPAAGTGKRIHTASLTDRKTSLLGKAFLPLNGIPIMYYTLNKFIRLPRLNEIIIAVNKMDWVYAVKLIKRYKAGLSGKARDIEIKMVKGGKERFNSVGNALKAVNKESKLVLIHDAARPMVKPEDIIEVVRMARKHNAAILAVPVVDTIKEAGNDMSIRRTIPRKMLWAAQTPQGFKKDILLKAYKKVLSQDITDDASLAENMGIRVRIVKGSYDNIKITTPSDMVIAEKLLKRGK
jgi:2-C-methyl-D-erythritol 4-phosphate cytidylyltransferase